MYSSPMKGGSVGRAACDVGCDVGFVPPSPPSSSAGLRRVPAGLGLLPGERVGRKVEPGGSSEPREGLWRTEHLVPLLECVQVRV